jgi:hypothetical protein
MAALAVERWRLGPVDSLDLDAVATYKGGARGKR